MAWNGWKPGGGPKKWPLAWKRNFIRGRNCFLGSPGRIGDMPFWRKIAMSKQKIDFFVQNTNIFGSKLHFFVPRSLTGQCFQHERGVSLVPWYEGTKSLTPFPEKKILFLPKIGILGQILAFWVHFVSCPSKKQCKQGAKVVFRYVGAKTFASSLEYMDFWQNIGILGPFGPMPD